MLLYVSDWLYVLVQRQFILINSLYIMEKELRWLANDKVHFTLI